MRTLSLTAGAKQRLFAPSLSWLLILLGATADFFTDRCVKTARFKFWLMTPVPGAKPEPAADVRRLVSISVVGGLHHRYIRVAA